MKSWIKSSVLVQFVVSLIQFSNTLLVYSLFIHWYKQFLHWIHSIWQFSGLRSWYAHFLHSLIRNLVTFRRNSCRGFGVSFLVAMSAGIYRFYLTLQKSEIVEQSWFATTGRDLQRTVIGNPLRLVGYWILILLAINLILVRCFQPPMDWASWYYRVVWLTICGILIACPLRFVQIKSGSYFWQRWSEQDFKINDPLKGKD